jgi:hypothetical protein
VSYHHLVESVLGATFVSVWLFIAVTLFRDKLLEARAKRLPAGESDTYSPPAPHMSRRERRRRAMVAR